MPFDQVMSEGKRIQKIVSQIDTKQYGSIAVAALESIVGSKLSSASLGDVEQVCKTSYSSMEQGIAYLLEQHPLMEKAKSDIQKLNATAIMIANATDKYNKLLKQIQNAEFQKNPFGVFDLAKIGSILQTVESSHSLAQQVAKLELELKSDEANFETVREATKLMRSVTTTKDGHFVLGEIFFDGMSHLMPEIFDKLETFATSKWSYLQNPFVFNLL